MFNIPPAPPPPNHAVYDINVEKYGTARQATNDSKMQCRKDAI
jgi:hypothetical protein